MVLIEENGFKFKSIYNSMLFYVGHLLMGSYIIHDIVMHAVCVVCPLIFKKLALTFINTLGNPLFFWKFIFKNIIQSLGHPFQIELIDAVYIISIIRSREATFGRAG